MLSATRPMSRTARVLLIAAGWTLLLMLLYTNSYLFIGDLVALGKLSGDYEFWPDFWGNVVVGLAAGAVAGFMLVFRLNAGYRHRTFLSGILIAGAAFLALYVVGAVILIFAMPFVLYALQDGFGEGVRHGVANLSANLLTPSFPATALVFALLVSGTQFMLQVNDKFGPGVLWRLVTGKYYHATQEERVFMFLDLRSSTELAERMGHQRFFELLRELFQDVTKPIIDSDGDIYQYVGDEVVITWPLQRGLAQANCIACFFRIQEALAMRQDTYVERFGVVPSFKAGVHLGEATVGEIGVVKKDIVYSGDVLNTTSRIQEECNRYGVSLIVSSELVGRLSLDRAYVVVPLGEIQLKGKSLPLGLSEVRAAA